MKKMTSEKIQEKRLIAWNQKNTFFRVAEAFFKSSKIESGDNSLWEKPGFYVKIEFKKTDGVDFTHRIDFLLLANQLKWRKVINTIRLIVIRKEI